MPEKLGLILFLTMNEKPVKLLLLFRYSTVNKYLLIVNNKRYMHMAILSFGGIKFFFLPPKKLYFHLLYPYIYGYGFNDKRFIPKK